MGAERGWANFGWDTEDEKKTPVENRITNWFRTRISD